jgi:hypothetical protein
MQPQTPHPKPVMDVAAPPKPVVPVAPPSPAPSTTAVTQPMAVAPAPDVDKDSAPAPLSGHSLPLPEDDVPETPAAPLPSSSKQPKKPALEGPHVPVALITITVLVMLALSGVAILMYLTSK